jgi:GDP-L-fucose synthase
MHEAKVNNSPTTTCWGDGSAKREFMHVDDMAAASVHLMNTYSSQDIVNIGTGVDISIYDFAHLVAKVVGYKGKILWDISKPNGTPRKSLYPVGRRNQKHI